MRWPDHALNDVRVRGRDVRALPRKRRIKKDETHEKGVMFDVSITPLTHAGFCIVVSRGQIVCYNEIACAIILTGCKFCPNEREFRQAFQNSFLRDRVLRFFFAVGFGDVWRAWDGPVRAYFGLRLVDRRHALADL